MSAMGILQQTMSHDNSIKLKNGEYFPELENSKQKTCQNSKKKSNKGFNLLHKSP